MSDILQDGERPFDGTSSGMRGGDGGKAGEIRTMTLHGGAMMDLVRVAPGASDTGQDDPESFDNEKPVHRVAPANGRRIGRAAVTQRRRKSVMESNPSEFKGDDLPVEWVSWNICREFLEKANASHPPLRLSLPAETQREFAARGGTKSGGFRYAGSDDCGAVAWCSVSPGGGSHPVGTKAANEPGVCDMSGNVWELRDGGCGDCPSGAVADPTGRSCGANRAFRGGCRYSGAGNCRPTRRNWNTPDCRCGFLGFRVAASAEP